MRSSREHAGGWALASYGFRVVISSSFADFFREQQPEKWIAHSDSRREQVTEIMRAQPRPRTTISIDLDKRG